MIGGKGKADAGMIRRTCGRLLSAPPGHPARGRTVCRGRSPGSRVVADVRPSRSFWLQWHWWTLAHRLQLRGQRRPCDEL